MMKIQIIPSLIVALLFSTVCHVTNLHAAIIFSDDFESDLSQWTGKNGGAHNGVVVGVPLRPGNNVLSFTATNSAGDIYSLQQFNLNPGQLYRISFEYLGLAEEGSVPGDLGGFAGLSEDCQEEINGTMGLQVAVLSVLYWLMTDCGIPMFSIFLPPVALPFGGGSGSNLHLMFENSSGSAEVAGDVYFDNIQLEAVPAPSAMLLFGTGLASFVGWWWWNTKNVWHAHGRNLRGERLVTADKTLSLSSRIKCSRKASSGPQRFDRNPVINRICCSFPGIKSPTISLESFPGSSNRDVLVIESIDSERQHN